MVRFTPWLEWLEAAGRRHHLPAAAGFCLLTCFFAWRVVVNFSSHLAGHGGDGWQNFWNMWWFREALLSGRSPFWTDMLHHPHGHTLLFHTLNPFNCALALFVDLILGQPGAYNFVFLVSFVASGLGMYFLLLELGAGRAAALLGGCIFTFGPFHFAHAQGHMQLVGMEWLPLFLLFAVRAFRRPGVFNSLAAGVSLGMAQFCSEYFTFSGLAVAGVLALFALARRPREFFERRRLIFLGVALAAFLATGGIMLAAMLLSPYRELLAQAHDPRYWSADLQGFFVPGWISAWGDSFRSVWGRWTGNSAECSTYLGYLPLLLVVLAFLPPAGGRRPWAWLAVLLSGMFLSLGPVLHLAGRIHDGIPLPFALLEKILPPLRLSGAPVRWHIITVTGLSVLAGLGAHNLFLRWSRLGRRFRWPLAAGCGLLLLLEILPRWVESRPVIDCAVCHRLAEESDGRAVYDLGDGAFALFLQTQHRHPLVGGYMARTTRAAHAFLDHEPLLRALRGESTMEPARAAERAGRLGIGHVLVPAYSHAEARLSALGLVLRSSSDGLQWWSFARSGGGST